MLQTEKPSRLARCSVCVHIITFVLASDMIGIVLDPVAKSPHGGAGDEQSLLMGIEEEETEIPRSKLSAPGPRHVITSTELKLAANESQSYQWPGPSKAIVVDVNHSDIKKQYSVTMIDLSNRVHKYAILDICQRMSSDVWEQFANALLLPSTVIDKLRAEAAVEERYYLMLKGWLSGTRSHTFNELQELLVRFNFVDAVSEIKRRLSANIS